MLGDCRKRHHISKEALADSIFYTERYLRMIEKGERPLTPQVAVAISSALNDKQPLFDCCRACPVGRLLKKENPALGETGATKSA